MATTLTDLNAPPPAAPHPVTVLPPLTSEGAGGSTLWEVVRVSFDSLIANKTRSLLTMLGVIIGVMSVVALLALGAGASNAITGQIRAIGTNILTIFPGGRERGPGANSSATALSLDDANAITALGLPVVGVAPVFNSNAQVVAPSADANGSIAGVTAAYQTVNNLTMANGSFIDDGQVRGASTVIVLGSNAAK